MTETGIGEALQSLIDTLQVGGEELFRIFTEVQFALSIHYFLVIIATMLGSIIGLYIGYKLSPKAIEIFKIDSYDEGIVKILFLMCGFFGGMLMAALLVDGVISLYLHYQYPQYYAAKELISSLSSIT